MNRNISIVILILLVLLSGCSQKEYYQSISDEELESLQNKIQSLDDLDKQKIYSFLQSDIQKYKDEGDKAYVSAYYAKAIQAYEKVNFYEGKNTVPLKEMKQTARNNSAYHYNKALKYRNTDKKRSLRELNKVMINNPEYKDSKNILNELKLEMWQFLSTKEDKLFDELSTNRGKKKELITLSNAADDLRAYEYNNINVIKADKTLNEYYQPLMKQAIMNYKKSNIPQAKRDFQSILKIYKNDTNAQKYLMQIEVIENKQINLDLATKALHDSHYAKSIEYAKKVLSVDTKNLRALNIIKEANIETANYVRRLIARGKVEYKNKYLDKAYESFKMALEVDPNNPECLTYYNKIKRQLKTIKDLQ